MSVPSLELSPLQVAETGSTSIEWKTGLSSWLYIVKSCTLPNYHFNCASCQPRIFLFALVLTLNNSSDLQRRGTFRTAFEFSRLLYSLDPWGDPHGALLHLDFLSVKAGMAQWALDLWAFFESVSAKSPKGGEVEDEKGGLLKGRANVLALPGWAYARALALRTVGKEDEVCLSRFSLSISLSDW